MGLDDVATVDLARADAAVVGTLRTGEAALGPAVDLVHGVEQRVLLLQPEPGLVVLVRLHEPGGLVAVVELVGRAIGIPAFAEHEDVGLQSEGIGEDGNGSQIDVGIVARGLTGRRAIKVPLGQIVQALGRAFQRLMIDDSLRSSCLTSLSYVPCDAPWSWSARHCDHRSRCTRPGHDLAGRAS